MHEGDGMGAGPSERATHAGGDGPAPPRRMSARRKQDAVLRLPRGEDLELVSRGLGVTAAELSGRRDAFLAAGEASLRSRPAGARDDEIGRLKEGRRADDGRRAARGQDRAPGGASPFGPPEVGAMSRRVSPPPTGPAACGGWRASGAPRGRPSPATAADPTTPRAGGPDRSARWRTRPWSRRSGRSRPIAPPAARATASSGRGRVSRASAPAAAASRGSPASTARRRAGRPHGPKARDGTIATERVDTVWGTGMTAAMTGE